MSILCTVLYIGAQKLTQEFVVSRLQHDTESVIAALLIDQNGLWYIPQEMMSRVYNRVHSGHYYQVMVSDQSIRSRSLFDIEINLPASSLNKNHYYTMDGFDNGYWLVWVQHIYKKGEKVTIWIAEDISSIAANLNKFILFAIFSVILSIITLLIMQYHILQRSFVQLEHVREAIRNMRLGLNDLSLKQLPIEISPLVDEIDRLLLQLGQRVQRSRNALGNLAHELKRPLQQFQSQVESMDVEQRNIADSILKSINEIVERELKRAKIIGIASPGRFTIIDEDIPHLLKALNSVYPEKIINTDYPDNLILPFDRDDMLELIGNLLDNACKFADKSAFISFEVFDKECRITVKDDGCGVSEKQMSIIDIRGVHLDESAEGHGLGLSICKDIVDSYSGLMTFQKNKQGGLTVIVKLPKAYVV